MTTHFDQLFERFGPTLERIRAGAVQRELDRRLPEEEIKALRALGITGLRVPKEYGGEGLELDAVVELYIEIASADSNVAQALRGHFAFTEQLLESPESEFRHHWLTEIASGKLFGNAESERRGAYGDPHTFVDEIESQGKIVQVLNGTKFYTTGTYFADYAWTTALWRRANGDEYLVSLPVDVRGPGVEIIDDWTGFGQRLTASGTTTFSGIEVDPRWIVIREPHYSLVWSYLQINLLSVLVGSADAAVREVAERARSSSRNAWNPGVEHRSDPAATAALGDTRSRVTVLRGALVDASRRVAKAAEQGTPEAFNEADAIVASLWSVVSEQALYVTSHAFDAVGASAALKERAIDRHWRNVRTVSSNNPVSLARNAVGEYELNGTPVGTKIGKALERPAKVPA
ncbi:acyl-CoA dehydrogenase family protein [Corynebacterium lubricantis]|uniref:acyl-CoA dehydrogenase family protein n=1 Tax=Corynebacterium lubricantis TaxID=541095 RepID=UPI0003704EC4|nr:acyl-CoA dehydrogenase family protein [Corynebacterium lubricantis]